jgi:PAS domain S-box-containing protein
MAKTFVIGEWIYNIKDDKIFISQETFDLLDIDKFSEKGGEISSSDFFKLVGLSPKQIINKEYRSEEEKRTGKDDKEMPDNSKSLFSNNKNSSKKLKDKYFIKSINPKSNQCPELLMIAKEVRTIGGNHYFKGKLLANSPKFLRDTLSENHQNEPIKSDLLLIDFEGNIIDGYADYLQINHGNNCLDLFNSRSRNKIKHYLDILNNSNLDEINLEAELIEHNEQEAVRIWLVKVNNENSAFLCSICHTNILKEHSQKLEQLYLAFENTQEGVGILDSESKYIYLNKAHISIFGYENEKELLGKSWEILYDEKERKRIDKVIFPEFEKTGVYQGFTRGIKKNGEHLLQHITLRKTNGFLICITSDATENIIKQDLINEFNLMLSSMSDIAIITDQQGNIEWYNNSFKELVNIDEKEQMNLSDLFSFSEQALDINNWFENNELNKDIKVLVLDRFGSSKTFMFRLHKIKNQVTENYHFAITGSDISKLMEKEKLLSQEIENQRELNFLKTNFINFSSHELRSPLTALMNNIDLINFKINTIEHIKRDDKEKFDKYISNSIEEIRKIENTINNVLLLGKLDNTDLKINAIRFSVIEIIKAVIKDETRKYYGNRSVRLITKGSEKLIKIDVTLFVYVIKNMISNALKYSEGKSDPEFIVDYRECLTLIVRDYGVGIMEEDLKKIFKPFFRGENAKHIKGTGLGLSIIKQIIDLHKGEIRITSEINKGTTIHVVLYDL